MRSQEEIKKMYDYLENLIESGKVIREVDWEEACSGCETLTKRHKSQERRGKYGKIS